MAKHKSLTVKLDPDIYAEFSAAAIINRHRTLSGFVYEFVRKAIRDSKAELGPEEFKLIVDKQQIEINRRSKEKKAERERSLSNGFTISPRASVPIAAGGASKQRKKRTG